MAVHTIRIPDRMRGRELRTIVWDDEAGTVAGDHVEVDDIRRVFDAPKPVTIGDAGGTWDLNDPAHDPAEFLTLLFDFHQQLRNDEALRATLPAVFDDVEPLPGDAGEFLYDEHGNVLI